MSEFYRIKTTNLDDSKFACCDLSKDTRTADSCPTCPMCGVAIGFRYWIEPRSVILSKPKYGDFVTGLEFLVSERFKSAYEKTDLKGIQMFMPVEVEKVRYSRPTSPEPPQYYAMQLVYSFAKVDLEKSVVKGKPREWYCPLCAPFRSTIDTINGIYIDDTNWGGEDIFHLHEMGGSVYGSQKFVDFCLANEFTNFQYVNTKYYVR